MDSQYRAWIAFLYLVAALILPAGSARSEESMRGQSEPSIHLAVGDSVQSVEQALRTSEGPTHTIGDPPIAGEIRLRDRGIWVFFNGLSEANQYRFDAPFAGSIYGARIGATIAQIAKIFGNPARDISVGPSPLGKSYLYRINSKTTIRCDFDANRQLETIRVLKGTVTFNEPSANWSRVTAVHGPLAPVVSHHNNITNLTIPGSLAVTRKLGCVSLAAIDYSMQPPDLYAAIPACITAKRYSDGIALFMLAGLEATFDGLRLTDKSAGQAREAMITNAFNPLPPKQRRQFFDGLHAMMTDPSAIAHVCKRAQKLGATHLLPRIHDLVRHQGVHGRSECQRARGEL